MSDKAAIFSRLGKLLGSLLLVISFQSSSTIVLLVNGQTFNDRISQVYIIYQPTLGPFYSSNSAFIPALGSHNLNTEIEQMISNNILPQVLAGAGLPATNGYVIIQL